MQRNSQALPCLALHRGSSVIVDQFPLTCYACLALSCFALPCLALQPPVASLQPTCAFLCTSWLKKARQPRSLMRFLLPTSFLAPSVHHLCTLLAYPLHPVAGSRDPFWMLKIGANIKRLAVLNVRGPSMTP